VAALSGEPLLDDATTVKILSNVEDKLMGPIGVRRYLGDLWDGREARLGEGREAQWSHVSPMMSVVYGDLFRRTGDKSYLDKQTYHFNRTLGSFDDSWRLPEAYIPNKRTGDWIPDANARLAWAQGVTLCALEGMEESLKLKGQ
jgi:hypothetical protein